jgi:hypothetical protein
MLKFLSALFSEILASQCPSWTIMHDRRSVSGSSVEATARDWICQIFELKNQRAGYQLILKVLIQTLCSVEGGEFSVSHKPILVSYMDKEMQSEGRNFTWSGRSTFTFQINLLPPSPRSFETSIELNQTTRNHMPEQSSLLSRPR